MTMTEQELEPDQSTTTRSRVSKVSQRVCQVLLLGIGLWWAFGPAQQRLDQAQIPGFLIALAASWWLTPEIRSRAVKLKLLDKPGDDRRIHKVAVPRLGGVAIYISILATVSALIAIAGRLPKDARFTEGIAGIAVGGTIIFVLGLLDDLENLRAKTKLLVQILAGCAAYSLGVRIKSIPIPASLNIDLGFIHLTGGVPIELGQLSLPLTVLWLVGVANAVNLIDGMDGLAAGVSAISALTIWSVALGDSISRPYAALMAAVMAGALLGFLRWNFNPARIFLGDSGAYLTGFTLAAISITGVIKGAAAATVIVPTSLLVVFILFFPLLDTSWAIVRRVAKGKSIFSPDRLHIHHRLLDAGLDQKKVAYIIYFVSALLGLVATFFVGQQEYYLKLIASVLIMALFFAEVLNRHRQRQNKPQ
ncbi:MAG: undecaprenyl/decaprenyl-phosphate alpha-N-acetylglucosaminyl 1-phosphate transferase [Candidatus Melainabacteria bacterium]|uniref:Undecaprenyl/decaprenyl-phosphate alpha-N-acetylglucosaminyl 1-phosphate transferase n=1 Tax=Candidatus Obscuribacter phosphatis TaxID=1906157 RepID=A0A8J7TM44_9BACT|nr:undecaprenyl/decaprenyl-phosphate alpha-N-acetylglucosaminyl 1-phosphate transferase [Candidatus Obscuribacter phosphatis]MCA0312339.1 undecaprenyl/decaprenyl-phosphate alpha-N-acetylglucosaminyl 1-phosphate transferase [Candidatus Melainabacteria bacterium]OPZ88308.1 MAG: putative undecaprenyl-phosphate N-acetylglucosaminyl 1-phosphate transferase [bacterium ADurb.Bin425]